MKTHIIIVKWEGPLSIKKIVIEKIDSGKAPDWSGDDYGLYQIYGKHILCGKNTLLYIGQTTEQTFSERIQQHDRDFLKDEEDVEIYLGRVFDPNPNGIEDGWQAWLWDIDVAERILIYKYCPNYNSQGISNKPSFPRYAKIKLIHEGDRNRLNSEDIFPDDL